MGVQRGCPAVRMIGGKKYRLYRSYNPLLGETEQKRDLLLLKQQGINVKMVNEKKGPRMITRGLYTFGGPISVG
jgi:hypothetical protein